MPRGLNYSSGAELSMANRRWDKEFAALMKGKRFESYDIKNKLFSSTKIRHTKSPLRKDKPK